tara:strand:- start:6529 stop:6741 length:213 start_codon:yes stop_codon:yes gene_type:complete
MSKNREEFNNVLNSTPEEMEQLLGSGVWKVNVDSIEAHHILKLAELIMRDGLSVQIKRSGTGVTTILKYG